MVGWQLAHIVWYVACTAMQLPVLIQLSQVKWSLHTVRKSTFVQACRTPIHPRAHRHIETQAHIETQTQTHTTPTYTHAHTHTQAHTHTHTGGTRDSLHYTPVTHNNEPYHEKRHHQLRIAAYDLIQAQMCQTQAELIQFSLATQNNLRTLYSNETRTSL